MTSTAATTHAVERTSPKGEPFIGTCRLCGTTGLGMGDALKPCPNQRELTDDEALIEAIDGLGPDILPARLSIQERQS